MRRVVVVGSINMDVVVRTARYPDRGETVSGESVAIHAGGKGANQAVAAAGLGAASALVGCVGDDAFGADLIAFVSDHGVDTSLVRRAPAPTGTAVVVVDEDGENTIIVALGANGCVAPEDVERAGLGPQDVLVCQLETPRAAVESALEAARRAGAASVLNAAPRRGYAAELAVHADVVVVNELERAALGRYVRPSGQTLIVTLGPRGVTADTPDGAIEVPGRTVPVVDTTGAGDCFTGALAARLVAGDAMRAALRFANAAASLCVQREGAGPSMPALSDVGAVMAE